jgi:plasmid stabilization system protein ParE
MNRKILLRRGAQREFDEAAIWYDKQRRGLGLEFRDAVDVALSKAATFPDRFPKMLDEIRCIHVEKFPYRVFYISNPTSVTILAIFHVRRNPAIWQSRV